MDLHVGKSDNWLQKRLDENPDKDVVSTFTNEVAANRAQGSFVKKYKFEIEQWLKGEQAQMSKMMDFDYFVGNVLKRGEQKSKPTNRAFFLIRRSKSSPLGWYFHTSYTVRR